MLSNHLILCPTPALLPGKSHGQRSLVGCGPWGRYESDTTERLHFHFSLVCNGGGNGSPLQCSPPGTGEPGGLLSMGLHRIGHNWSDLAAAAASSVTPFSSCPQSFPASGFFPMSWLFASGDQYLLPMKFGCVQSQLPANTAPQVAQW